MKFYINPSSQEHNVGIGSYVTEEGEMTKVADALMPLLATDGRFEAKRDTPNMDVDQISSS